MTKYRYIILFSLFLLLWTTKMQAQSITVPFICGFEEQSELQQWTLNPHTPNAADQWCVGNATYFEGAHSLYISNNGGLTAAYGCSPNIVIAYRTIKFPQKTGKYNITFDWKTIGDEKKARLYVWLGRKEMLSSYLYTDNAGNNYGLLDIVSENSGLLPEKVLNQFNKLSDGTAQYDYLYGSLKWQNCYIQGDLSSPDASISLSKNNAQHEYVLAFIWQNANIDDPEQCTPGALGACIDNIQIASSALPRPSSLSADMQCEDSTLLLTWTSPLAFFDVEYRNTNEPTWRKLTNLPASDNVNQVHTCAISMREEGNYHIRVRGCNAAKTDTSAYASLNNVVYWCPDNHCINYITLEGENVECRAGGYEDRWEDCFPGMINEGEEARESRHTINWIENRYDPLTTGSVNIKGQYVAPLQTIPDGSMASVRLGNWNNSSEQESITYTFEVDSFSQAILIMKYAIVFEDPGHPGGQPLFNITVLNVNDQEINPTCGKVNFMFDNASEWNRTNQPGYNDIYWKDWTSVGLDLRKYHGLPVKVRITTKDCGQGGHFGYAYFVLDCVSATLETNNCGAESTITLNAPEGFTYRWTDSQGKLVGTDRSLTAETGYEHYSCEACMKEMKQCCFTLSTDFAPRYPYPEFTWTQIPHDCQNIIQFTNKSHVLIKYEDYEIHTEEPCDQVIWDFDYHGESYSTPADNPRFTCRPEGDTIAVRLRTILGGGACFDLIDTVLNIPGILSKDSVINAAICEGRLPYIFAMQECNATGVYYDYQKNFAGCDSTTTLHLTVHPESPNIYIADTVCSTDLPYVLNGISYPMADTFTQRLSNQWGCDSLVILSLAVVEKLNTEIEDLPTLCADDKQLIIDYHIMAGQFDSLAIRFSGNSSSPAFYNQVIYDNTQTSIVYPYDLTVLPGTYHVQLEFYQHKACSNQIFEQDIDILYSASIIEQKWNNVLALLNSKYNGGYTFTAYQWYKNGEPIAGETGSYLHQDLDMTADYSVLLCRENGVFVQTCPFRPTPHTDIDINPLPTLAHISQNLPIRNNKEKPIVKTTIYDAIGEIKSAISVTGDTSYITAPASAGHYIVHITYQDGTTATQHLIVTY